MPISLTLLDLRFYAAVGAVFLLIVSILVFAHELGHYLFARFFGMGVEEFAIGFGKRPICTYWRKRYTVPLLDGQEAAARIPSSEYSRNAASLAQSLEAAGHADPPTIVETPNGTVLQETTSFTIRPLPFGGFVRIKGMMPEEDGSETRIAGGFYSKPPWQRFLVLLAGPLFSVLAGIVILTPYFILDGIPKADNRPILGDVYVGQAADKAGLWPGDVITSIDGKPVTRFFDIIQVVRANPGNTLTVAYTRKGVNKTTLLTPTNDPEATPIIDENLDVTPDVLAHQGKMGAHWDVYVVHPSLGGALAEALMTPVETVENIGAVFAKPSRAPQTVSGPGRMLEATGIVMQEGILKVMWFMGMLSISVGILNLLPFPPLDGGQMSIALAEMLRGGRRLSLQVQSLVITMGMAFVMLLMVSALWLDFREKTHETSHQPLVPKTSPPPPAHATGKIP